MSAYPKLRKFTPQEYLKIERAATFKSEYVDGRIYQRASATLGHSRLALNAAMLLKMQLRGKGCMPHTSDLRVAVARSGPYFYPDFSVARNPETKADWGKDILKRPILIGEVSSDATARYDREVKVERYRLMPSLRDILLISHSAVEVEHHYRDAAGTWARNSYSNPGASIALASVPISLPVAEIYDGLEFS